MSRIGCARDGGIARRALIIRKYLDEVKYARMDYVCWSLKLSLLKNTTSNDYGDEKHHEIVFVDTVEGRYCRGGRVELGVLSEQF